ncbi:MAG: transposase [Candidatus Omnitrophota bacterium]
MKRSGKTKQNKQRYYCKACSKTFIWRRPDAKQLKEQSWFKLWVKEGYSIRQLCKLSGHSHFKLKLIKNYWLDKLPDEFIDYAQYKYIIYDGTYFHKNGCLISLMDAKTKDIISNIYAKKEGFKAAQPWFERLKKQGLNPSYIIMDGEISVIRAINAVWSKISIQRCLYHIQREGMRWLRTYPKTEAGIELRRLLGSLCTMKSIKERDVFINSYRNWLTKYKEFVKSLPVTNIAFKDLKRTIVLINNALPDMFHYLKEPNIPSTTNALEGYYSRLKADYRRHRGLSQKHKIHYLKWYCFLKNNNTN